MPSRASFAVFATARPRVPRRARRRSRREEIMSRINSGDMPPEEEKQPKIDDIQTC